MSVVIDFIDFINGSFIKAVNTDGNLIDGLSANNNFAAGFTNDGTLLIDIID